MNSKQASAREPEIQVSLNRVMSVSEETVKMAAEVHTRFAAALREVPSSPEGESCKPCSNTPMANTLESIENRLRTTIRLLSELLERCELPQHVHAPPSITPPNTLRR